MIRIVIISLFNFYCIFSQAQVFSGIIKDQNEVPLQGVVVYFLNTSNGTSTDQNGAFVLIRQEGQDRLVVAFTGFQPDTIQLSKDQNFLKLQLNEGYSLNEVTVESKRESHSFSLLNPLNIETLESEEFKKAACCSLAESFQTSNAVDVTFNNAVAGTREIQFLGLRGVYTQQLIENRPVFTGILATAGYDLIPGTWLDQINILKGAGSAIYGAQSMTGAINVGLKKPNLDHPIYANIFGDIQGRTEVNLHLNKSWNSADHSGLYLHGSYQNLENDHNKDGFADEPQVRRLNGMWRNTFFGRKTEGQLNIQALTENKSGGQFNVSNPYRLDQQIDHINLSGNFGYVGFDDESKNTGSIFDISYSKLNTSYGNKNLKYLDAYEWHGLAQFFYTQSWNDQKHQVYLGPAININIAQERFVAEQDNTVDYKKIIPGIFLEYNLYSGEIQESELKKWIVTFSSRLEYLPNKKWFYAPRISTRYNVNPAWTLRASVGRGYRFARFYADHSSLFVSAKRINLDTDTDLESSYNMGVNLVGKPSIANKELQINMDVYYTTFEDQLVVDQDQVINGQPFINFYSLDGRSDALNSTLTASYPIVKYFSLKIGGKYAETKTEYRGKGLRDVPFIPKIRGFLSADFDSQNKHWQANLTTHFTGRMRLPDKEGLPHNLINEHSGYTKPFWHLQAQLNYTYSNWEFYIGAENLTNYKQHSAIIDSQNPFGNYFNASEVYAPITGINSYAGIKWHMF
ncbi:MAG: TonB-dependent receptor [Bacteroidota bacterium]|nr:TonB-dependent receptor [Bacteroidota bacterium]